MDKYQIDNYVELKRNLWEQTSDAIWQYAETRFEEFKSAETLSAILEQEGFTITKGVAGIPTAFTASFGNAGPVVGFLGEYDALSGLSQVGGVAEKKPLIEGGNGHGCGHHLLGVGSLAAAVAVKKYMQENHLSGTVRYFGCPGEEGGSGKAFMARDGVFHDVDIALTWHPLTHNAIWSTEFLANFQVFYKFHGKSAHAAAVPHLGRSALDAVELMNVGVNYLREHIIPEARIHYAVTNTGGKSPNVVQAEAEVLYLMRAPQLEQVQDIYERVCNVARGAAMMTGTECEIIFQKACSNYIPNQTIETLMYANLQEVGVPQLAAEEEKLVEEIQMTLSEADRNNDLQVAKQLMGANNLEIINSLKQKRVAPIILPYRHASMLMPGSTDVGDVSWVVPTAQLSIACYALGTPGHSWQLVSQGKNPLAHKGMLAAAKVLARTAADILLNPPIVEHAKTELQQSLGGKTYVCPIPPEVMAPIPK